jgi:hypothetical protein
MLLAPVTNWEPPGVTFAGYCYAMRHGMKVEIVTPYRVSHLQRYGVTVRGNVTGMFGALSVFGCRIKGVIRRSYQVWSSNVIRHHRPLVSRSRLS